jgi:hypothetical protein
VGFHGTIRRRGGRGRSQKKVELIGIIHGALASSVVSGTSPRAGGACCLACLDDTEAPFFGKIGDLLHFALTQCAGLASAGGK